MAGGVMALLWPSTAHAYLDGGTAALLFQALAAALFGALFAVKMFWARIVSFFRSWTGRKANESSRDA